MPVFIPVFELNQRGTGILPVFPVFQLNQCGTKARVRSCNG